MKNNVNRILVFLALFFYSPLSTAFPFASGAQDAFAWMTNPPANFINRSESDNGDEEEGGVEQAINIGYEYEDREIARLLELRLQEALPADRYREIYQMAPLNVAVLDEQLREALRTIQEDRDTYAQIRMIFIPLNIIRDNHWVGVVVRLDESGYVIKISYIDSLRRPIPRDNKNKKMGIGSILHDIFVEFNGGGEIEIERLNILIQTDGTSCGPLMVENLISVAQGDLEEMVADVNFTEYMRRGHVRLLDVYAGELNFGNRQASNTHTFSYPDCPDSWAEPTPIESQEKVSAEDKKHVKEIIKLCKFIIDAYHNHPETFVALSENGYMGVRLPLTDSSPIPYNYLHEVLNKIFDLAEKISWDVKNSVKYQNIPWKHLTLMKDILIGNTEFPEESKELSVHAVVDFIRNKEQGIFALQEGFKSLLSSEKPSRRASLLRCLGGFYYDGLIYRDILDRLNFLIKHIDRTGQETLEWKLALLRILQVSGEHFKSQVWISGSEMAILPRKLLLDGRDSLSHVRIRQLSDIRSFLEEDMSEEVYRHIIKDVLAFDEGVVFSFLKLGDLRLYYGNNPSMLWDKITLQSLERIDNQKKWNGLERILQKFEINDDIDKGPEPDGETKDFIEVVVNKLLPCPAYKRQHEAYFDHESYLRKNIRDVRKCVAGFIAIFKSNPIPSIRGIDEQRLCKNFTLLQEMQKELNKIKRSWNKCKLEALLRLGLPKRKFKLLSQFLEILPTPTFENFQDFLVENDMDIFSDPDLMRYLYSIWSDIIKDYSNYQESSIVFEERMSALRKQILQIKDTDIMQYKRWRESIRDLSARRTELKNYLISFSRRVIPKHSPGVMQRQYEEFCCGVKRIIKYSFGRDDAYHQSAVGYLELIFNGLMEIEPESSSSRLGRRYENIKLVNELIGLLKGVFDISEYTLDYEIENNEGYNDRAKTPKGRREIRVRVLNGEKFELGFTQKKVTECLKDDPLKLYAAEYLIGVICECMVKELFKYPEVNRERFRQLDEVRNYIFHPEGTYRSSLDIRGMTTYVRNYVGTVAQQIAQIAINIQAIIEDILNDIEVEELE